VRQAIGPPRKYQHRVAPSGRCNPPSDRPCIRIWTYPLISSHVHHHLWTYPLMAQHLLIQVPHHCVQITHATIGCSIIAWCCLSVVSWKHCIDPLGRTFSSPSAKPTPNSLFLGLSPSESPLAARRQTLQCTSLIAYRLAATPIPSDVIPVQFVLIPCNISSNYYLTPDTWTYLLSFNLYTYNTCLSSHTSNWQSNIIKSLLRTNPTTHILITIPTDTSVQF